MKFDAVTLPFELRGVLRRWRSLLGMIAGVGIALGIGMVMMGVSKASAEMFTGDFRDSGVDLYVLTRGGVLVPVLPGDTSGTLDHGRRTLSLIRSTSGVNAAIGIRSWTLERERPGPRQPDQPDELMAVMGVDGDPTTIPEAVVLREGRWFERADEIVLGARMSRELGLTVGHLVRLGGRELRVVGIGRLRGAGLSGPSLAYLDMQTLRVRIDAGDTFELLLVDTIEPALLMARLEALGDLRIMDRTAALAEGDAALASDRVAHGLFIGLTLAIAALFVGSVLGRSVADRRMEFATMRAIGIPRGILRRIVLGEALVVSAPATLIGAALSSLLGAGINAYLAPIYGMESFYEADVELFGSVGALAVAVGLLAGFIPAQRATRVDPVDVLREA